MKNGQKWTLSMRIFLYETLLSRFGRHEEWGGECPKGRKEEFEQCLEELAVYFSDQCGSGTTSGAVHSQFSWAVTKQGEVKKNYMPTFFKNVAAAHEVGFISSCDLPKYILLEPRKIKGISPESI